MPFIFLAFGVTGLYLGYKGIKATKNAAVLTGGVSLIWAINR